MTIKIISIGKKPDRNLAELIDHYQKQLKFKLEWVYIAPPAGELDLDSRKKKETELLNAKLKVENSYTILLDETGISLSSVQLADKIKSVRDQSLNLVFIIGGAFGVDLILIKKPDLMLSLSKMVFPHQLIKLILIEQIYRSQTIIDNRSYHHQ